MASGLLVLFWGIIALIGALAASLMALAILHKS